MDNGQTPILWAAWNGNEAVVKLLLEAGKADVDSKNTDGRTALSRAAENGHEAVVKLLQLTFLNNLHFSLTSSLSNT
jgi:ankyrin repeat protein